jgi:putative AbiEii toxin of type IV toxin-antitoxin system/AAA domain-containing protein
MPISHFFAEGIGPFKKVHLDLRGADGRPSLGPHILAGVNGSGKSTILKAIAWCLAQSNDGFPGEGWGYFLRGANSHALLTFDAAGESAYSLACTGDPFLGWETRLPEWVDKTLAAAELAPGDFPLRAKTLGHLAAYSSTRVFRFDAIESWLLSLCSRRAISKERDGSASILYTQTLDALERGLRCVCGEDVSIDVALEPDFRPVLTIGEKTLNLSQITDGLKATLGWMGDFMMRPEAWRLLLFDGIEGSLHPLWQRRILQAMREALPETQSIVTSHSPFVISSCADAVVHVLKVNKDGSAYAEPPVQAPIGESITSTLKDIFGVDSRFDVETEKQLNEWNELNKVRVEGKLEPADEARFKELTRVLASRSEELRSIVSQPAPLPKAVVDSLTQTPSAGRVRRRVATH